MNLGIYATSGERRAASDAWKCLICLLILVSTMPVVAQTSAPGVVLQREYTGEDPVGQPFTPAEVRMTSLEQRTALREHSLVSTVSFRNVGPTVMSGRVVDLDVRPEDPTHFYVAYASGGLWKTTSNGTAFSPLFDDQTTMTLGDIAVDWANEEVIWVGTGENNSSRSSYAGTGIYKSTDGGETWTHLGLAETHHIGRIILHPEDPNTVWVASIGHLYSSNPERGVYKTTDGGQSWQKTLFIDDSTGVIDLVPDPTNPDILYAAAWHRARTAWNFIESGESSGIYKSTDGGETWTLISGESSGFPTGDGVGRIGLAVFPDNPDIVYALLDNQDRRPQEEEEDEEQPVLTRDLLRTITREDFLLVDEEDLADYLERENFSSDYSAERVREMVEQNEIEPVALVEYVEDANSLLFDTPVTGAEVYRSDDGGATWTRTHDDYIDRLYNSYGYYFGEIRVSPHDADRIYILGVPILRSDDGGKTFVNINQENVHVDHHALWANPDRPGHLINGNDGGVNITYDAGETWFKLNTPAVGQFYDITVDMAEPYNIYGGLQDNGVWYGPSTYESDKGWQQSGDYPYDELMGGDGMEVQVDTRTNGIIYTGFQFGFYSRIDQESGNRASIKPRHDLGERPLRFNWQTPIHLSRHNQDILYLGSNKVHRSFNQGEDFEEISDDLTQGGRKGDVPFGTLTTLDESPLQFGVLYAGSDDGLVHVTRDGGQNWTRISGDFPAEFWVSRVEASHHDVGTVYVTLNGYRWDHFEPYLYRSTDFGATWERLGEDLPMEPINVVAEDPENANVLYVGTDHGVYVSLNGGTSFMGFSDGLPDVPVHDLEVHPREKELVVGTHGRSIYIGSVAEVQELTEEVLASALQVFDVEEVNHNERWGEKSWAWGDLIEPEVTIPYYIGETEKNVIRIKTEDGEVVHEWERDGSRGLNYATYDLSTESELEDVASEPAEDTGKRYLKPGTYTIEIEANGETKTTELVIAEQ